MKNLCLSVFICGFQSWLKTHDVALRSFGGYLTASSPQRSKCKPVPLNCKTNPGHILHCFAVIWLFCLVLVLFSGCAGLQTKKIDANEWAKDYYGQQRTGDLVTLKGKAMSITMTGVDEMKLSAQLPPISIIPREPSWYDSMSQLLPTLGLAWMGISAINKGPTIVTQPQPLVVEPTVITK